MSAFYDQASLVVVPSGYKSGKIYAQKPLTTDGQLTFTRASTATRVNASGVIEEVASGVPRLDYTNSSCPKILLEPQRSNLALQSNNFLTTWTSSGVTFTTGQADPFGGTSATLVQFGGASTDAINQSISVTSGVTYTMSAWIKGVNLTDLRMTMAGILGTVTSQIINGTWVRISFTATASSTGSLLFQIVRAGNLDGQSFYIYQAQVESGTYATSPIFTTTAAVTRLADQLNKTGISSLIGQTEGTLFVEIVDAQKTVDDLWIMETAVNDTSVAILIYLQSTTALSVFINNGTTSLFLSATVNINQPVKIAVAYKAGQYALAVNGVIADTSTNAMAPPSGMNQLAFHKWVGIIGGTLRESINQALLFKTRLPNSDLATLTSL